MIGSVQGVCSANVCEVSLCGDGFIVAPEQCDSGSVANPHACVDDRAYYDDVAPGCHDDCTYDYTACTGYCGDNMINGQELCDGTPPELSCVDIGYYAGFLGCSQCGPGVADCKFLNWTSHVADGGVRAIHGTDDRNVFAAGDAGVAHYNGAAWTDIDFSACVPAGDAIYVAGVAATGNGKALVVGGEATLGGAEGQFNNSIVLAIDGSTCKRTVVATGTHVLRDVAYFSDTNIWAVGDGMFHFDGTTWTHMSPLLRFQHLWASAANDIYAAGTSGLWHFDGTSWTQQRGTVTTAVAGGAANDVYVIDSNGLDHWNGTAWSGPLAVPSSSITALASDGSHLFGGDSAGAYVLDGAGWTSLAMPFYDGGGVTSLWASTQGNVYATRSTRVARYPGGNLTSEVYGTNSPTGGEAGLAVAAPDADHIDVLSNNGLYIYASGAWTSVPPMDTTSRYYGTFSDMWRSPTGLLYFARQASSGNTMLIWDRTQAPGSDWTESVNTNAAGTLWGTTDSDVWIASAGSPTVLQHFDGATIDKTDTPGGYYRRLWGTASNDIFAVGGYALSGSVAHYDGVNWTTKNLPTSYLDAVWGRASNDVYVAGTDAFLHFDGTKWTSLPAAPGFVWPGALWGTAGNDLFISTKQGLFHYDGFRWSPVRTTLNSDIYMLGGVGDLTYMLDNNSTLVRIVRTLDWSNSM